MLLGLFIQNTSPLELSVVLQRIYVHSAGSVWWQMINAGKMKKPHKILRSYICSKVCYISKYVKINFSSAFLLRENI